MSFGWLPGRIRLRSGGAFCSPSARSISRCSSACTAATATTFSAAAHAPSAIEPLLLLSAGYVFGCAFRSILPRADVQRICLFDTWLSSVLIGRSVATIAELCFAIQWAIVLARARRRIAHSDTAKNIAKLIVPLIVARGMLFLVRGDHDRFSRQCSGKLLWTVTFVLIARRARALAVQLPRPGAMADRRARPRARRSTSSSCRPSTCRCMSRAGRRELADGTQSSDFLPACTTSPRAGSSPTTSPAGTEEIPWMSLYFSVAVWTSLLLGGFGLVRHHLPRYRVRRPLVKAARRPLAIPVRTS